jgi:hypothetical protein
MFLRILFITLLVSCSSQNKETNASILAKQQLILLSYFRLHEYDIHDFIAFYKTMNPAKYLKIENDRLSMWVQDTALGIGKGNIQKQVYQEQEKSLEVAQSFALLKWSYADYYLLKSQMSKLNIVSVSLIPSFKSNESYYSFEFYCTYKELNFFYKIFSHNFSEKEIDFFETHLTKKQQGGIINSNTIWYYTK